MKRISMFLFCFSMCSLHAGWLTQGIKLAKNSVKHVDLWPKGTHHVVSPQSADRMRYRKSVSPKTVEQPHITQVGIPKQWEVLFSRDANLRERLLGLINDEHRGIAAAMYMITDPLVAQALVDAYQQRGVFVEVMTDTECLKRNGNKTDMLSSGGVPVYIHKGTGIDGKQGGCMHHKIAVFEANGEQGEPIAWTGSFNCTGAATEKNCENVVITRDAASIVQYRRELEAVKAGSYLLSPATHEQKAELAALKREVRRKSRKRESASSLRFQLSSPLS